MHNFNFEPLRVRAYLQTPVVSDQFLPLDGIIYYHFVRDRMGEKDYSLANASNIPEGQRIDLPFRKNNLQSNEWFYKCSFAQWPENTYEQSHSYNKRFDFSRSDLVDFGKKKAHVDNQRGHYKSYHNRIYCRSALYIDWYCDGDKQELGKILRFCTHLGKKTSQGYGAVLRWEVVRWPEDWSIRNSANKLMRAVPAYGSKNIYGIRPSYWLPKHQVPCLLPSGGFAL